MNYQEGLKRVLAATKIFNEAKDALVADAVTNDNSLKVFLAAQATVTTAKKNFLSVKEIYAPTSEPYKEAKKTYTDALEAFNKAKDDRQVTKKSPSSCQQVFDDASKALADAKRVSPHVMIPKEKQIRLLIDDGWLGFSFERVGQIYSALYELFYPRPTVSSDRGYQQRLDEARRSAENISQEIIIDVLADGRLDLHRPIGLIDETFGKILCDELRELFMESSDEASKTVGEDVTPVKSQDSKSSQLSTLMNLIGKKDVQ
jgi:hypothetical protein